MDYSEKRIRQIICNFDQIRSTVYQLEGFELIVCITVDIEKSLCILTEREKEVIKIVMKCGMMEAAQVLKISQYTVHYHIYKSCKKIFSYLEGAANEVLHKRSDNAALSR